MNQKNFAILTLLVVVTGSVLINEFILHKPTTNISNDGSNREVASFGERFEPEQIKWEQELAKTVSKDTGHTVIGDRPSINDKFLFEALAGKYEAHVVDGKLIKIKLIENQLPLGLNIEDLIKNYSSVFKGANSFVKSVSDANAENFDLKNKDGKSIGKVTIQKDDQGRVLHMEIQ